MSDYGTPVRWQSPLEPWASPQFIPPSPHNMSRVPLTRNLPLPLSDLPPRQTTIVVGTPLVGTTSPTPGSPVIGAPVTAPGTTPQFQTATAAQRAATTQAATFGLVQDVRDTFKFANITTVSLTIGTTSFKFLDQPVGKRNFLGFRNPSTTATIYIDFANQATANSWLALGPGGLVLFDNVVSQDDLYVVASAASTPFAYAYSTYPG